jgi:peptidoglycan/LPS O-acetylase OafA/YrhL
MRSDTVWKERIAGLDGLRAFAVIAVVLTHYGIYQGIEGSAVLPLIHGMTGVRLFFVLSGFLITRLLLREFDRTGRISYANFIVRRALRIVPLYLLFLILATLLLFSGLWKTNPAGLTYAWLYFYNFVPPRLYDPLLAHTWTLAVEEHFYVLWPIALLYFVHRERTLIRLAVLCALLCFFSYVVMVRWLDLRGFFLERMTFVAAFPLLIGCLCALFAQFRANGILVSFCRSRAGLATSAILFAAPTTLYFVPYLSGRVLAQYFAVSLQSLGLAMFVLWILFHQGSRIVAALETLPLKYIGMISYGIYIWQGFFLAVSPSRSPDSIWPPPPGLGLIGVMVFAPLSYHLFEKRFLAMKGRVGVDPKTLMTDRRPFD